MQMNKHEGPDTLPTFNLRITDVAECTPFYVIRTLNVNNIFVKNNFQ